MSAPFKMKNSGLAYSAKHKSPVEYASPAKSGADQLAASQARLNNQKYQENLSESINKGSAQAEYNSRSSIGKIIHGKPD